MSTQDTTSTETMAPAKANGTHMKVYPQVASDAVSILRSARLAAQKELERTEERAHELRVELGLELLGGPPAHGQRVRMRTDGVKLGTPAAKPGVARARKAKSGRLARRSDAQIAKAVSEVVALVKRHAGGQRAEQIRDALGLEAKEMPRILKAALASKALKKSGQKRATVYASRPGK